MVALVERSDIDVDNVPALQRPFVGYAVTDDLQPTHN